MYACGYFVVAAGGVAACAPEGFVTEGLAGGGGVGLEFRLFRIS